MRPLAQYSLPDIHRWMRLLRLCPAGTPGKSRLARTLLKRYLSMGNVVIETPDGYRFLVPSLHDPIAFYLLIDGMYEPEVAALLSAYLYPGTNFIDVGANIGMFTVFASNRVGSTGCVIAIEPSSQIFPYLQHNVQANRLSNVRLIRCAAYDQDNQQVAFYEAPRDHFGMGSLAAQFHAKPDTISAQTLAHILADEHIAQIDILKVDVEGAEAAVFDSVSQFARSPAHMSYPF
jgi:FkbM family methyltransferase